MGAGRTRMRLFVLGNDLQRQNGTHMRLYKAPLDDFLIKDLPSGTGFKRIYAARQISQVNVVVTTLMLMDWSVQEIHSKNP